jgi:hypothetical protein
LGEGEEEVTLTSFRDDNDFSTDIFDESIVLPDFPNNIGVAFVRSSDSPADYLTIALKENNTSTVYINNTANNANLSVSGDVFIGYDTIPNFTSEKNSYFGYSLSSFTSNLFVNGIVFARQWVLNNARLGGKTSFGLNTIEIDSENNSISGVGIITATVGVMTSIVGISSIQGDNLEINGVNIINANVGVITAISGITTITPTTELNVNGGLVVSGISTVGLGTTSNLTTNSTLSFELTSNTNLRIRVRGSDGVIRSANLTLS